MKKINSKEFAELIGMYAVKGVINPIIEELKKIKVGEMVKVDKEEWTRKTPLGVYLGNYKIRNGLGFSVRKLGEDGWVVTRTI